MSMPARSVALLVLVTAVWGVNFVLIHKGLEHFPPLLFNALRFALMAVPAIFLVGRPRVPWRYVLGIGATLGVVKFGLLFVSIDQGLPVGLSSLLLQLQVVFTIAFASFPGRERADPAVRADRRRGRGLGRQQHVDSDGAAARRARAARLGQPRRAAPAARALVRVRGSGGD